jgi:hypothetical protein
VIHCTPPALVDTIRTKVIIPLKDAMRLTEYKEHDKNYAFYLRKKVKASKKEIVFRSYSFKLKGTLKHEMYLKALSPAYIKNFLGDHFAYKLIIKPNRVINMQYDSKNKRSIELVLFFKKSALKNPIH